MSATMKDELKSLSYILSTESDLLALCLQAIANDQGKTIDSLRQTISETIQRIASECQNIANMQDQLNNTKVYSEYQSHNYDLIRIRANKLIVQNEKIFNCNQKFKDILNKVPRIYPMQQHNILVEPQKEVTQQGSQLTIKSYQPPISLRQTQYANENTNRGNFEMIPTKLSSKAMITAPSITSCSVQEIITELQDIQEQIHTHRHPEYEDQLRSIQSQNMYLASECNLLKTDNTDLMHHCNDLRRKLQQTIDDNERLAFEMNQLKQLIGNSQSNVPGNQNNPNHTNQNWILIPKSTSSELNESNQGIHWLKEKLLE